jgi:hypothetical protein
MLLREGEEWGGGWGIPEGVRTMKPRKKIVDYLPRKDPLLTD